MSLSAKQKMRSRCRITSWGQVILATFQASWWPSVAGSQPMQRKRSSTNCRRGLLAPCSSSTVSRFSNSSTDTGELANQALEPTAYSFGFAYASGGGSPPALGSDHSSVTGHFSYIGLNFMFKMLIDTCVWLDL